MGRTGFPSDKGAMYYFVIGVIGMVGLMQIPIMVDLIRAFSPGCKLRRTTHWFIKAALVTGMSSFFIVGLSYFLLIFLPLSVDEPFYSCWGIVHVAFALWIWINLVFNYFMAVFVNPGTGSNQVLEKSKNGVDGECLTDGMKWETPCFHYCSVCQQNITYMDHHCPFTGNCTGLMNYSYFFLFLIYGALGLGYALWMSFSVFKLCVLGKIWWVLGFADLEQHDVCKEVGPHAYIFLAVLGGFYVTLNMTILQVLLLIADLSSYDILKNVTKLPVFTFACHRIRGKKFMDLKSRLNLMLLRQRPSFLYFLFPYVNTNDVSLSILAKE